MTGAFLAAATALGALLAYLGLPDVLVVIGGAYLGLVVVAATVLFRQHRPLPAAALILGGISSAGLVAALLAVSSNTRTVRELRETQRTVAVVTRKPSDEEFRAALRRAIRAADAPALRRLLDRLLSSASPEQLAQFRGPRGMRGPRGWPGVGATGAPGADGRSGVAGRSGRRGAAGSRGATGGRGEQGEQGKPGVSVTAPPPGARPPVTIATPPPPGLPDPAPSIPPLPTVKVCTPVVVVNC